MAKAKAKKKAPAKKKAAAKKKDQAKKTMLIYFALIIDAKFYFYHLNF